MNLAAIGGRLRDLEKEGRLEKLLGQRDDAMPWGDIVWMLQWPGWIGVGIQIWRMANAATVTKDVPPAEMAWCVILALVAAGLGLAGRFVRTKEQRVRQRLRRRGLVVPAALVQANDAFFDPGNDRWLPGSVLVSFDPAVVDRPETLARVGKSLFAMRRADRRTLRPEHAAIAWTLYHEMGPTPSIAVPPELTEGLRDCLLVSAMLPPKPALWQSLFVCLALPGESSPAGAAVVAADVLA